MANGLTAQSLTYTGQFNWPFLVEILIVAVLAIFFLFYFNRLFATVVSFAIRAYTWNQYKAYIDIEALQFSILGGRVFFKSIRYHAHNVTLYVYEGHVTWRYWLRLVQQAEVFQDEQPSGSGEARSSSTSTIEKPAHNEQDAKARDRSRSVGKEEQANGKPKKELPCRISVNVAGVEAFIYNRSPVYDAVVEATMGKAKDASGEVDAKNETAKSPTTSSAGSNGFGSPKTRARTDRSQTFETATSAVPVEKPRLPAFLRIFPIKIDCKRAAAALGNENTKNVIVAKAERSAGTVDAGQAGPLDLWKLLFNFEIQEVNVSMKPNRDFKDEQLDAARRIIREREQEEPKPDKPFRESRAKAQSGWSRLCSLFKRSKSYAGSLRTASLNDARSSRSKSIHANPPLDQLPGQGQWHGLMRYLDDAEVNEHEEWQQIEYAKASELVNCPKITMNFHWDMPGPFTDSSADVDTLLGSTFQDDVNGSEPPDYGMDLGIYGGFVVYGPWADRQRLNLQPIFVPATYVDATPLEPLKSGDARVATIFKIKVTVEEDVVMRLPTREESKDAKWKGRADKSHPINGQGNEPANAKGKSKKRSKGTRRKDKQGLTAVDARPFGWIDITVKKDSVVNYNMDMYARTTGYRNTLDVDAKGVEMTSSVNHGLLWKSGAVTVDADLSQPLTWNTLRKWPFNVVVNDMELFILRDHLFLIIDLVNDWASGAPAEYYTFVPYNYQLDLSFRNFVMYLNVNDANIINDPADFERNDFLTIEGQLHALLGIPMEHYRPKRNQISFDVLAQDLKMRMISPPKSTFHTFVEDKTMAELPKLTLNGSFNGNQEIRVGNVDVLRMDIVGTGLTLKAFGFYVRQLVNIKENYFGDYMHFKTLEEFQGASDDLEEANAKTASFPKPTSINEMDVILCIVAEEATVLFPTNIYSCKEFVRAELPRADLDLRIVSYYLDMGLQLSPLSFLNGKTASADDESSVDSESSTQFYVQHVDLNGHRSFGLPPNEDAYVSQWDIDVGKITGELSSQFLRDLVLAAQALTFSISDAENALPVTSPAVVLDASFVQVRTDIVRLWLHVGNDALLLDVSPVKVDVSDWASALFSQRVSIQAPLVTLACVDGMSASRHRLRTNRKKHVRTYAFLQTGVSLDVVGRRMHFDIETEKQQRHFRLHDQRTSRFPFLIRPDIDAPIDPDDDVDFAPPAIPYPFPPPPLTTAVGRERRESAKSVPSLSKGGKFLSKSSSSSLSASVRSIRQSVSSKRPVISGRASQRSRTPTSYHSAVKSSRSSSPDSKAPADPTELVGETERAKFGLPSSTMAFSSSYSEPYFPLEMVRPDESDVPSFTPVMDDDDLSSDSSSSVSAVIDDPDVDHQAEHQTVLIRVLPGIRVYLEPRAAMTAAELMRKASPTSPEEVMDSYQMSVMGAVESRNAERQANNKIIEIQARLPIASLRVALRDKSDTRITDQVDLTLKALESLVRVRTQPSGAGVAQFLASHTLLSEVNLSLAQKQGMDLASPAVRLNVNEVLVWLALTTSNAVHASLRDTSIAVSGNEAKYLTELALRLVPLINTLKTQFEEVLANKTKRLQLLTYVLTHNGGNVGDPPFMARMLYILRAYPRHFRNTDSWKILSRFRYILRNLPSDGMAELSSKCKDAQLHCPDDAPAKVLESWTQWRAWDVIHVNQTMAFEVLFSNEELAKLESSDAKPTTVTLRSELLRITIECEKGNSDITLEDTSFGLENTPPTKPEGLMLVEENKRTNTLLQMHTNTITFNLSWALFRVAEDAVSFKEEIEELSSSLQSQGSRTAGQALEDGLARHDFHLVLSTDTGSVILQSINLRYLSRADGLKMSVVGTTQASEQFGQCASAILNFDTAITELHGPSARIWQSILKSPSLYVDHLQPAQGYDRPPTITLATAYDSLEIVVDEQVPGILRTVDTVIMDEVAQVKKLIDLAQPRQPDGPTSPVTTTTTPSRASTGVGAPKLHVAVLAGSLDIEISLLSTLSYQIEGTAASVRVAPSLLQDKTFSIDFDVGYINHAFVNTSRAERHTQGLLHVPPINGHVGLKFSKQETSVSVATTIDRVEIDAGAIQGVIAVVNRPEVQNVVAAIKSGVEDIREHVIGVFPEEHKSNAKTTKPNNHIAFDARLALLGVRVSASTPQVPGHSTAEVEFGIGPVHATASNRSTPEEIIPEVRAQVQDIGANLNIKERGKLRRCGNAMLSIKMHLSSSQGNSGTVTREFKVRSDGLEINAYPETAPTIVDVINHLQDRIKDLDLSKEVEYLRRLRDERRHTVIQRISGREDWTEDGELPFSPEDLLSMKTTIELHDIQVCWLVGPTFAAHQGAQVDDLIFSIQSIALTTSEGNEVRLTITDLQLQLAKKKDSKLKRALNSALMPYIGFSVGYWSHGKNRSLTFKASGKPLDLRLESRFILPANAVQKSVELAIQKAKRNAATWQNTPTVTGAPRSTAKVLDTKHLESLLIEADFAGAKVYMQGSGPSEQNLSTLAAASQQHGSKHGRYGQFASDGALLHTTLTAPGFSFKLEYNSHKQQPTVNGELLIEASTNMLLPNVVPLMMEVSDSVKELVQNQKQDDAPIKPMPVPEAAKSTQRFFEEESIVTATPAKIFGKITVDLGFRIAKQEFGLTCQPIARVDAKASLEDFYITMNTIDSDEHGHFFAMSAVMTKLQAQVKHMYSREPTFSYDMESVVLSAMNNKHLNGTPGISAILNVNPTRIVVNGKQFQDLLLFREIWLPPEVRNAAATSAQAPSAASPSSRPDEYIVQRYQTVAAAAAFPWNATVSIAKLSLDVDLGQSIGKSSFTITNLWASQQKSSSWEQNLCVGMDEMAMSSTGRMSGFIQLEKLGVRTSIKWPEGTTEATMRETPLIQASIGFGKLRAKAAFDYQAFAFGDIEGFDFLMYNVRDAAGKSDRLVAVLDCEKAFVFCTSTSPAQAVGLYQAFDRLIQEKQSAFAQSLRDIEKHLRRESTVVSTRYGPQIADSSIVAKDSKTHISLHTDVVVTMGAICFGVYPSTFFDSQMLKLEANNIQARFAVGLEGGKITSGLGMTLGQLQVALSSVRRITAVPKASEVTVDDVINSALNARGGIILRVPKVVASMQTWQAPDSNGVDYIFKSLFDGKIDVGWNLSRINFIKGMWNSHSRALASRLGKSLPESAVKITAGPQKSDESTEGSQDGSQTQDKITAEISLPQSRYEYRALEPPVIETPQLRDMGEATPPLEWIGLNRDRLPNVTHQIIIVSLLEMCKEVEDAYEKILGSS
ncbi:related to CSF1 [Lecanosticta acicola]|uniref:Related to CSF1 n=1 Tax=Lecanosticta acicola TaxID=111012 RepID=A0AAI8YXB5_9PEZI|nr:related to CSF1 [Lecanosticta acicola]